MVKKKKLFGIFDKRPLIWFHYVLLTLIVQATIYITVGGLAFYNLISWFQFFGDFIIYFPVISISDQLIHYILGVD